MLHTWWFLIFGCTICTVRGFLASPLNVGIHESHCQQKEDVLFCDYADVVKEHVQLKRIQDDGLKKVFLYNIGNLSLSDSVCVNVALHNVENVELKNDVESSCDKLVELYVKKCNLNRIPSNITSLILIESNVSVLATSSSLSKFSIESSEVEELVLNSSFVNGTKALIKDSRIFGLSRMVVGPGTSLEIQHSILNITERNGLETNNGSLSMKESSITTKEDGITLSSGATLTLENLKGQMTVLTKLCVCECLDEVANGYTTFVVLFVIFLLLFVLSWAAFAYMVFYRREYLLQLFKQPTKDVKEMETLLKAAKANQNPMTPAKKEKETDKNRNEDPQTSKVGQKQTPEKKVGLDQTDSTKNSKEIDNKTKPVPSDASVPDSEMVKRTREAKESYIKLKENHTAKISELITEIDRLKSCADIQNSSEHDQKFKEIQLRCSLISEKYNFLRVLKAKEIYILTTFAVSKHITNKADAKNVKEFLATCEESAEEACLNESLFRYNNEQLSKLLDKLIKSNIWGGYGKLVKKPIGDAAKCIQMFHANPYMKEDNSTKALGHIAQIIYECVSNIETQVQILYEYELDNHIKFSENVFLYVTDELVEG